MWRGKCQVQELKGTREEEDQRKGRGNGGENSDSREEEEEEENRGIKHTALIQNTFGIRTGR